MKLNQINYRQFFMMLMISMTLISCVTINIYFPAAAAEKAAEQIVEDVLKSGESDSTETSPDPNSQSHLINNSLNPYFMAVIDFIFPSAHASQANISIETPAIRALRSKTEQRHRKLLPFYKSGNVGFTNNGLIAVVNLNGLNIKNKSIVKKLIKAENNDRLSLYKEIAKANGHPEWQADIQKTFSRTWINKIKPGWMYQNPAGQWQKK